MSSQQHVDFHRKLLLRKTLLRALGQVGGAAYVPFIGDGDIAYELYGEHEQVFGADLDAERVKRAAYRLGNATVVVADCDRWPFGGCRAEFTVGDFDAYAYPYDSFRAAWAAARWGDRVALFFTDGQRFPAIRCGKWREPDGTRVDVSGEPLAARRKALNAWTTRHLYPWMADVADEAGYRVARRMAYTRLWMVYWGVLLVRT